MAIDGPPTAVGETPTTVDGPQTTVGGGLVDGRCTTNGLLSPTFEYFCVFFLVNFIFSCYDLLKFYVRIMESDCTIIISMFYGSTWCKRNDYRW